MSFEPHVLELDPPPDSWETARRFSGIIGLIFFDSAGGPAALSRYSYVSCLPFRSLCTSSDQPLDQLAQTHRQWRMDPVAGLPPFQGGVAGLFGYGLSRSLEELPARKKDLIWQDDELDVNHDRGMPDLDVSFYDWVIAWDHQQGRAWIVSTGLPARTSAQRDRRAKQRAEFVRNLIETRTPQPPLPVAEKERRRWGRQPSLPGFDNVFSEFTRGAFEAAIRQAIEYTHAGDCFQVNIAQQLFARLPSAALDLYGRLRSINPSPFAAYFERRDYQILSASPERFLRMSHDGQIETRPIKGTRPRGVTPDDDAALQAELLASPKDRAENVMIVDLLRNDLGRVCEYGSVNVESLCKLETYPTVHHLVSEVRGRLRPGLTAIDLLKAAFPGGSVTGAPKVRAMEIIAELEPHARGAYCGSLGWIGFDGAMDTNILIRTFTAAGGWLQFPVGGGIVADSDPAREYDETLHKAAGLLRALEASMPTGGELHARSQ